MTERDEILMEYAVEPVHDRETLERYLRRWPEHANALIDLSREISRPIDAAEEAMPAEDIERLGRLLAGAPATASRAVANPLARLSREKRAALPGLLRVPSTVVLAFRECRIILTTVPDRFMRRFAAALETTVDELRAGLAVPAPKVARAFKADAKPVAGGQVSFEQILIDALVSEADRAELLGSDE
ncbi:hypothetical protein [Novosphingobium rosa]|uniref:hypothetical protein n=1 Tax=Novosphingobium rosa TaxID=76978 RepID=UPI00082F779C|nr:hypothetical protein [Novosphingobium rosa]